MGQCYSVYLKIKMKMKNEGEFIRLSRKYATENEWSDEYIRKMSCVDGVIKQVLLTDDLTVQRKDGWLIYRSDFDAYYSWELVLDKWFNAIAPSLEDGSEIEVYPDRGHWGLKVIGGVAAQQH